MLTCVHDLNKTKNILSPTRITKARQQIQN